MPKANHPLPVGSKVVVQDGGNRAEVSYAFYIRTHIAQIVEVVPYHDRYRYFVINPRTGGDVIRTWTETAILSNEAVLIPDGFQELAEVAMIREGDLIFTSSGEFATVGDHCLYWVGDKYKNMYAACFRKMG